MTLLGDRVVAEQIDYLRRACATEATAEGFAVTNVDVVIGRLRGNELGRDGKDSRFVAVARRMLHDPYNA